MTRPPFRYLMLASRNNNGSLAIWRLLQTGWPVVPPTSSISDTWELVRNADFQALPKLTGSEASLVAQTVKNLPAMQRPRFDPWVWKIPWRRKRQPTPVFLPREVHGQRSLAGYSPWGRKSVGHNLETKQQQKERLAGKALRLQMAKLTWPI